MTLTQLSTNQAFTPQTFIHNNTVFYLVPGFTGYAVSRDGKVISNRRRGQGENKKWEEKAITLDKASGYSLITLTKDTHEVNEPRQQTFGLHRLMYMSIISGTLDRSIAVDHIDNNRQNNTISNLQLLTIGDNLLKDKNVIKVNTNDVLNIYNDYLNKVDKEEIIEKYHITGGILYSIVNGYSHYSITGLKKKSYYKPKKTK
jgi:hypothetical protein